MSDTESDRLLAEVAKPPTVKLLNWLRRSGLNPKVNSPFAGSFEITLRSRANESFGRLYVGAKSGRVLRMFLSHGNKDPRSSRQMTHFGARDVEAALEAYDAWRTVEPKDGAQ